MLHYTTLHYTHTHTHKHTHTNIHTITHYTHRMSIALVNVIIVSWVSFKTE